MCEISFKRRLVLITYLTGALAQINVYDDRNRDFNRNVPINRPDYNYDNRNYNYNTNDNTNVNTNNNNNRDDNFNRDNYDRNNYDPNNVNRNFDSNDPNVDRRFQASNQPFNGDVLQLLQALDVQASQQCTNNVAAQWNFETNVNQATQLEAVSICKSIIKMLLSPSSKVLQSNKNCSMHSIISDAIHMTYPTTITLLITIMIQSLTKLHIINFWDMHLYSIQK